MKAIAKDQLLIVRGSSAQGLTSRGRVMISPIDQLVTFTAPNRYEGIRLEHITGPLQGVVIQFTRALCRKPRGKPPCVCSAYQYPHAKGRGKCQHK